MTKYEDVVSEYVERMAIYRKESNRLRDKITMREKQIVRLNAKQDRLQYPHWTEGLLRPLWEEVKTKFQTLEFEDASEERLVPLGMCCRVTVFAKYNAEILMVGFVPGDVDKGELYYETGKEESPGAYFNFTGNPNGFGRVKELVTSVRQIENFLRRQLVEDVFPEAHND